ncbi:hypothetical protein C5B42_04880 [Candidatus Cerribacteria bacterium 'Amazon FNV 2010 28 9']|uniref:Prepilin-type N-terminal cleavage/methylation domain-containing protein n=1 Tax=Candidatus Cerribacteria bacterium 'Amazon FNV 2010 28 9' TaxID=2081795 RepID=A0A317JP93_9BACT|nr:MAG: hypothetical protein C5B42_04880 [Candidatus Cerribacteria bacterium 'Amazon FNV 2010 28 9']
MVMKHQDGYTLIELIVVVAITILLLVTVISMFYTAFVSGGKTTATEAVKEAGQYAMSQMEFFIENAHRLVPNADATTCAVGMSSLGLQNQDLGTTIFQSETVGNDVRLASNSGTYLTPSGMSVTSGPTFSCTQPADSSPATITISFTLQKGVVGVDKARDIVTIPFQSQVTLRNY